MSKTLVLATSAAVALGSFVAAYADPMFAPNGPPPCSYDNPGLPDFQLGSRG